MTAQRNAAGAKSYFAQSDYYWQGQEMNGEWGGKGAILLGLFGDVDKHDFDALCDNLNPRTGRALTAMTRDNRRVGYDFTWSAPKSVSVVHALTGDERIVDAFRRSIRRTMSEMEADTETRVRKDGQEYDRPTGNLVYSEFVHLTSRPVDGLPCPQLHAHCFAFNATYDVAESEWKAGQFGRIKGSAYYWQAVQQARFAGELQKLGYGVRPTKDAFEIAGVPDSAIAAFSLRSRQIEAAAMRLGITDPKVKAKLGATTREAKLGGVPYADLVGRWKQLLKPEELAAVGATKGNRQNTSHRNAAHARFAVDHLFERSSVVDERRLLTLALRHGVGEVTPEGVRAEADRLGLLKRMEAGTCWVTTADVLAEERRMLGFAVAGKSTCGGLGGPGGSWRQKLVVSVLSPEQQAAVTHLLSSEDRVMILRGVAGAGKTTLTKNAVEAIRAHGTPVVLAAPTVKAVEVLRADGFDEADTLARLLVDPKMQEKARGGVIWADEAGLVSTRGMAELFELAGNLGARVILAGDKKQLASVERGSPLRVLEELGGLKVAEVREIRRQSGQYREAVKLLSDGKAGEALDKLEAMGCVKLLPVWESYAPIAREYVDTIEAAAPKHRDKAALIVCPTHAEGGKINDAVRAELRGRGLIRGEDRVLRRLSPLQWTAAERGDGPRYAGDEVVQFRRNSGAFKAGEQVPATEAIRLGGIAKPDHFAVYSESTIGIAGGDLLRVTAKGKSRDGKHTLGNGSVYRVAGFDRSGDVVLANGWVVGQKFGHWAHAYVNTAYASQGRTVDHVLVAQSSVSYPAASKEAFYVAVSRGRHSVSVYTDDRQGLREAVGKTQARPSAIELAAKPGPQLWRRMRQAMANVQLAALVAAKAAIEQVTPKQREFAYER